MVRSKGLQIFRANIVTPVLLISAIFTISYLNDIVSYDVSMFLRISNLFIFTSLVCSQEIHTAENGGGHLSRNGRKRTFGHVRPLKIQIAQSDQNLLRVHLDTKERKVSSCGERRL